MAVSDHNLRLLGEVRGQFNGHPSSWSEDIAPGQSASLPPAGLWGQETRTLSYNFTCLVRSLGTSPSASGRFPWVVRLRSGWAGVTDGLRHRPVASDHLLASCVKAVCLEILGEERLLQVTSASPCSSIMIRLVTGLVMSEVLIMFFYCWFSSLLKICRR